MFIVVITSAGPLTNVLLCCSKMKCTNEGNEPFSSSFFFCLENEVHIFSLRKLYVEHIYLA